MCSKRFWGWWVDGMEWGGWIHSRNVSFHLGSPAHLKRRSMLLAFALEVFFPPLFSAFLKQYGSCGLLFPPFVCFCFFLRESKASLPPPFPRTLCLCAQSLWCCRLADAPLTLSLCPFSAEMLKITLLTDVPFAIERGGCVKKEKKLQLLSDNYGDWCFSPRLLWLFFFFFFPFWRASCLPHGSPIM